MCPHRARLRPLSSSWRGTYGALTRRALLQVYAEVVGGLSAFTTVLYLIPFILRFAAVWIWNLILFILWIALFGVFGNVGDPRSRHGDILRKGAAGLTQDHRCTSTQTRRAIAASNE